MYEQSGTINEEKENVKEMKKKLWASKYNN